MAWSKAKTVTAVAVALFLCGGTAFVAKQLVPAPAPPVPSVAAAPVDDPPGADDGRVGGSLNKLPDWRASLAQAVTDEQTNQIEKIWCVDNLKQVGFASYIWSTNNGHVFPTNLMSLKAQISPRYLTCPADDSRVEVTRWADVRTTNVTYRLVSPGLRETRPNVIMVRCPIHGHVALSDGRVWQGDYLQTRVVAPDNSVQ
jgi:hypothetical protein